MYHSYMDNKHDLFYANAVGNLDVTAELLESMLSVLLKPWAPKLTRFGFKEIDSMPDVMLENLVQIYPKCIMVFCFRDPLKQWPSLCQLQLLVSRNLDVFLEEYRFTALQYMKFGKSNKVTAFIENTDLVDIKKVEHIKRYLKIDKIDDELIGVTVHSLKPKRLSKAAKEKILASPAYAMYLKMQDLSKKFYSLKID